MKKVALYCQLGKAVDMAEFSIQSALANCGLSKDEYELIFICWKTSDEAYSWLKKNNYHYEDMVYDEGKGFLWNLYKGWNFGYEIGYKYSDTICPIATDHAFYKNWLTNLLKNTIPNRIVNCKLIEPGTLPTVHTSKNFGLTLPGQFNEQEFISFCESISQDKLVHDDIKGLFHENQGIGGTYGHRLDAMPFTCPKDVWERFGPMIQTTNQYGTTGDTDFFDRCRVGGVEITKALDAISYHCGGLETRRNTQSGVYT